MTELHRDRPYWAPVQTSETTNENIISRFLSDDGTTSGTKEILGDYSETADEFTVAPPSGQVFEIARIIVFVQDTGAFDAGDYGAISSGITNGITVAVRDASGTITDLCDGVPITNNAGWARTCYDAQSLAWGTGDNMLTARWTFAKARAVPVLDGSKGEYLSAMVNDDLSDLVSHTIMAQGRSV
jgi:hypothetical protein